MKYILILLLITSSFSASNFELKNILNGAKVAGECQTMSLQSLFIENGSNNAKAAQFWLEYWKLRATSSTMTLREWEAFCQDAMKNFTKAIETMK